MFANGPRKLNLGEELNLLPADIWFFGEFVKELARKWEGIEWLLFFFQQTCKDILCGKKLLQKMSQNSLVL